MLATGHTVKEIAAELRLSEKTISTYRARILEKMRMRTTAQLMGYALRPVWSNNGGLSNSERLGPAFSSPLGRRNTDKLVSGIPNRFAGACH